MSASEASLAGSLTVFACPACSGALSPAADAIACASCGKTWPLRANIPRFIEPAYYWGEIPKAEADTFIREAAELGWRTAVEQRFREKPQLQDSVLSRQRASWLALLGLSPEAVALDIGSGYGTITQSVSGAVKQVYSIEAIPQRLEFTRIRLEQEAISNVQLVQASAVELPFDRPLFDLIVVNGVLEWVGDWCLKGSPREVQISFLKKLNRILKPGGVVVIGIENRIGSDMLRGGRDHSGLPYTSLMPRFMASWWVRRFGKIYRTDLDSKREYRTYTYTGRGYRKLLGDSGLEGAVFYWADPGYNQPYALIPLDRRAVTEHLESKLGELALGGRGGWRSAVKRLLAGSGIMALLSPDFVIVCGQSGRDAHWVERRLWESLRPALPQLPNLSAPRFRLTSAGGSRKSVIGVFENRDREVRCILKSATGPGARPALEREAAALRLAGERIANAEAGGVSVPRSLGLAQAGGCWYAAESPAPGVPLARLICGSSGAPRARLVESLLPRCVSGAAHAARLLRGGGVETAPARWWELPDELKSSTELAAELASLRLSPENGERAGWVQHGDLTVENVFVQPGRDGLGIIDWEHAFAGGSPLYDVFTLLVTVLLALEGRDLWVPQFRTTFFGQSQWSACFREWITRACETLSVQKDQIWPMFLQCVLFRRHYSKERGSGLAPHQAMLLQTAIQHSNSFLFNV